MGISSKFRFYFISHHPLVACKSYKILRYYLNMICATSMLKNHLITQIPPPPLPTRRKITNAMNGVLLKSADGKRSGRVPKQYQMCYITFNYNAIQFDVSTLRLKWMNEWRTQWRHDFNWNSNKIWENCFIIVLTNTIQQLNRMEKNGIWKIIHYIWHIP